MIFRGTHLLFALTLVFILYPLRPGGGGAGASSMSLLLAGGWGLVLHIFLNYQYFTNRIIYIDELTPGTSSTPWSRSSWCSKRRGA